MPLATLLSLRTSPKFLQWFRLTTTRQETFKCQSQTSQKLIYATPSLNAVNPYARKMPANTKITPLRTAKPL